MKSTSTEAVEYLLELREVAVTERIRATHAVNRLIDKFPDIKRNTCYNSAVLAGINKLTARNVWDKRHDEFGALFVES